MACSHDLIHNYNLNNLPDVLQTKILKGTITAINAGVNVASVLLDEGNLQKNNIDIVYHLPAGAGVSIVNGGYAFKVNDRVLVLKVGNEYKIFGFLDGLHPSTHILFTLAGIFFDMFYDPDANKMHIIDLNGHEIIETTVSGAVPVRWKPQYNAENALVVDGGGSDFNIEKDLTSGNLFFQGKFDSTHHKIFGKTFNGGALSDYVADGKCLHYCNVQNALYVASGKYIYKYPVFPDTFPTSRIDKEYVAWDTSFILQDFCHDCAGDVFYLRGLDDQVAKYIWGGDYATMWNIAWLSEDMGGAGIAFNPADSKLFFTDENGNIYKASFAAGAQDSIIGQHTNIYRLKFYGGALYVVNKNSGYTSNIIQYIQ